MGGWPPYEVSADLHHNEVAGVSDYRMHVVGGTSHVAGPTYEVVAYAWQYVI
ncbi:hypothetical protein RchiOBHm_Chr5g0078211 [Rosa chinensis]|uniref:Uncharacterized protein n=1 Tax=Rosa chinensis TaxID=74649 RepID=A0A2P6QM67_ROSCH|nr:hypothetical protein RchiOBHm_Chr5g0078211 [Rosa chinensis]